MRKRMILALCLALVVLMTAVPAMAAGSVNAWLGADKTSVSAGSTVTVTVSAEVDSCGSGGVSVSFDSSAFELTGGSCLLSGTDLSYFDASTRDGAFAYSGTSAISGGAFQFTLKAKSGASSGSHNVSVTFIADGTSVTRNLTITIACDHAYDNGCDETCNRCGGKREVAHKYDSGKVTTAATCSKEGTKTYTCSSCGKTKTESVSKTAHTWDAGKVTKEATCSKKGEKLYTCSVCKATKTEATDTLRHNYEAIDWFPATCTENGGMTFKCVDCGYTYDDYIEARGHSYANDCDEDCDTCGETREVEHSYIEAGEEVEEGAEPVQIPWLSDKKGHWQECALCKKPQEPIPHTPGPEATETEDQVCLDCGFVIKAAVAHTHAGTGNFLGNDDKHWFLCSCGEIMGEKDHRWEDKGILEGQQTYKCIICSRVKTEPVETTAPTEVTTVPTEVTTAPTETTETTAPKYNPIDHVGILVQWWWVIPVGIVVLALLGGGIYMIIGLIVAFRKPGKYAAKKKK